VNGRVEGITDIQAEERAQYGPGTYTPVIWVTYWGFRTMVGAGFAMIGLSALVSTSCAGGSWSCRGATSSP